MDVQTLFGGSAGSQLVEHLVPLKQSASIGMKKIAIVLGAAVIGLGSFALSISVFRPLMSLLPFLYLVGGLLVWYVWRFVSPEYEYTLLGSEMDVDVIYGQRTRKHLCTLDLKQASKIAPYDAAHQALTRTPDIRRTIFAAAALNSEDTYFILFNDPAHKKTLLFVDAPQKMLDAFRRANPSILEKRERGGTRT